MKAMNVELDMYKQQVEEFRCDILDIVSNEEKIKAALKVQKEEGGYAGANLIFGPNGCCTHKKITPPKSPPKNHIYRPE